MTGIYAAFDRDQAQNLDPEDYVLLDYDPEFYRVRNRQMSEQALHRFWSRQRKRFRVTIVGSLCDNQDTHIPKV